MTIEIISGIFSHYNGRKQEINHKKKSEKNYMGTKHAIKKPVGLWRKQRGNKKKHRDKWKWKYANLKHRGCGKSSFNREDYSHESFP